MYYLARISSVQPIEENFGIIFIEGQLRLLHMRGTLEDCAAHALNNELEVTPYKNSGITKDTREFKKYLASPVSEDLFNKFAEKRRHYFKGGN